MRNRSPKPSGVYKISNKVTLCFYIGSSKDIKNRWRQHRFLLRKGQHHSPHLQRSWDKHGEDSFSFEILEECSVEFLIETEQRYLDSLNPSYNVCPNANGVHGRPSKFKGKTRSYTSEARSSMGSAWRGKSLTVEAKQLMSDTRKGRSKSSEWKNKIAESVKKKHREPTDAMVSGRAKTAQGNSEWKWITNGEVNKRVHQSELENLEAGFYRGRTVKRKV